MTTKIKAGEVEVSTTVAFEDIPGAVKELFEPLSEWRPPVFNITPGDAAPGTTIRARNVTHTITEDGGTIGFDLNVCNLSVTVNAETGDAYFVAVVDGCYELSITREGFIELVCEMVKRGPRGSFDLNEIRRKLDEMLPMGTK